MLAIAAAPWFVPQQRTGLVPASIVADRGRAHLVELPVDRRSLLRPTLHADGRLPQPMRLLEDGRAVGFPVASFDDVAARGGGRFAYQHPVFAFSTSDGSDPRTNGRVYTIERPVKARLLAWAGAAFAIFVGLILAFPSWTSHSAIALLRFGSAVESGDGDTSLWAARCLAFALTVSVVIAQLLWMWWTSSSSLFGIAGYLPVSDALGYYNCAVWIGAIDPANASAGINDWCSRRILYPSMLSSLLGFTGWRPSIALLVQATAIGVSAGVLLLTLQRVFGWVTALLTTFGVVIFATENAVGSFVTESFGLSAGLVGLALLLLAVRELKAAGGLLVLGLALSSMAMLIRPGAVFALPFLFLWTLMITRSMAPRPRIGLLLAAIAALMIGPLLHYGVSIAVGANAGNSGGNFAMSLYGLATGSREWSQAYRDFADAFAAQPEPDAFSIVWRAALQKIAEDPHTFIGSLVGAGTAFSKTLFAFGALGPYNALLTWLFAFGCLLCVIRVGQPAILLLLMFCAAEFVSAPFVYDSGGHRVFAVTVAARIAVVAYALGWIGGLLVRETPTAAFTPRKQSLAAGAAMLGLALLLLAVAPAGLSSIWRLEPLAVSNACAGDQIEVWAQPRRESLRMTFGSGSLPLGDEQLGSEPGELELDLAILQPWWGRELALQPMNTELIYLVSRAENRGNIVAAFSRTPLTIVDDRPLVFCLARQPSPDMKVGDLIAHEIVVVIDSRR